MPIHFVKGRVVFSIENLHSRRFAPPLTKRILPMSYAAENGEQDILSFIPFPPAPLYGKTGCAVALPPRPRPPQKNRISGTFNLKIRGLNDFILPTSVLRSKTLETSGFQNAVFLHILFITPRWTYKRCYICRNLQETLPQSNIYQDTESLRLDQE